jgi:hypothetical protein
MTTAELLGWAPRLRLEGREWQWLVWIGSVDHVHLRRGW